MLLALRSLYESAAVVLGGGGFHNGKPYTWTPINMRRRWLPAPDEEALISSLGLLALADAEDRLPSN